MCGNLADAVVSQHMLWLLSAAACRGFLRPGQGPRWQRPSPEPYASKYKNMQPKLAGDTAQVGGTAWRQEQSWAAVSTGVLAGPEALAAAIVLPAVTPVGQLSCGHA